MTQKPKQGNLGQIPTNDSSRKGDYWEALVELEAWKRGAEVFPNKGCTGKTDMVLEINGQLIRVDVKVMVWHKNAGAYFSTGSIAPGVYGVMVNPETQEIRWQYKRGGDRRGKTFKCPPGLEDFWS